MTESPEQNYMKVHQFEIVFAADSKRKLTILFAAFVVYLTRIPVEGILRIGSVTQQCH